MWFIALIWCAGTFIRVVGHLFWIIDLHTNIVFVQHIELVVEDVS